MRTQTLYNKDGRTAVVNADSVDRKGNPVRDPAKTALLAAGWSETPPKAKA